MQGYRSGNMTDPGLCLDKKRKKGCGGGGGGGGGGSCLAIPVGDGSKCPHPPHSATVKWG